MSEPDRSHPLQPSRKAILRASAVAILGALLVLVVVVLPAEYGIDPTGIGNLLHFTRLKSTKTMHGSAPPHRAEAMPFRQDTVTLRFAPDQGFEYKFTMRPGQVLLYSWTATDSLDYLFHGEIENDHSGAVTNYERKKGAAAHGSLTALFEGLHGWAWHNSSAGTVTLTLEYAGYFEKHGVIGAPEGALISPKD